MCPRRDRVAFRRITRFWFWGGFARELKIHAHTGQGGVPINPLRGWGWKFTLSFTPSSLPVLVPIPDLSQSHSVVIKSHECLVLVRELWQSILLNHSVSQVGLGGF